MPSLGVVLAYIDLASVSYLVQILVGFGAASLLTLVVSWSRFYGRISRFFSKKQQEPGPDG